MPPSRRISQRTTTLALLGLDVLAAFAVFNLIGYARGIALNGQLVTGALLMPVGVFMAAVYLVQGYRTRTDMLSVDYASQHAIATLSAMIITLLVTYVVFPAGFELQSSRFVIALSFVALVPLTLGYRRLLYLRRQAAQEARTIVFVGDPPSCQAFRTECESMRTYEPVLYAVPGGTTVSSGGECTFKPFAEILRDINEARLTVEAIVLREAAGELPAEVAESLLALYFAGVPTYTLELFHEVYWQKIPLYRLNQTWLFQEGFPIAREPVFERLKRALDVMISAATLVIAVPVIAAAGVAIWLEDRGPMFFVQTRVGRNRVPFPLVKLRTMRPVVGGERYTRPGDTRITRVGRFLRATRLDELPQLWNVLRGDMSLIGPRAEWDKLVADYERQIPCYGFRHTVRPGITGWAQVNYPYGASLEDTLRKLEYDLYYIRHFSFRLDATIMLKTVHVMLFGKGR